MPTLSDLLSRGYFPQELPLPFYTENYATKVVANTTTLPSSFTSPKSVAKVNNHNLMRTGSLRRRLGIPNPVLYFNISYLIEQNWAQIDSHVHKSNLSRSIPVDGPSSGRAVVTMDRASNLPASRTRIRAKSKFILRTDVSRFYPSIYTHSIPWAMHGKSFAKANRTLSVFGNALDLWVRNGQDGQTIGIPIGPDTSLIIAEIILSSVDQSVLLKMPDIRGLRHIDDFEFGFTSRSAAEAALAILQEVLTDYELALNPDKTFVIDLPVPLEAEWVHELRDFQFRTATAGQRSDMFRYFDRAFYYAKEYPEEYVLKYAVARIQKMAIDATNWEYLQHLLFQCLMVEPGTFVPVLSHLIHYRDVGRTIDFATVGEVMNHQITYHAPLGHESEVAWAIWTLIVFGLPMDSAAATCHF